MYLGFNQTSRMERFCTNSHRILAIFCKTAPSSMFGMALNRPLMNMLHELENSDKDAGMTSYDDVISSALVLITCSK